MKKFLRISLIVIGVIIGLVAISVIGFFIIVFQVIDKGAKEARNESKSITKAIEQLGGKFICDRGGGDGVDSEPWLYLSYEITDSPELTQQIKTFARQEGYSLDTDSQLIAELQSKQQFNPKTDYLITQNIQRHDLKVTIVRDEKISLYCEKNYTKEMIPTPGQAIIQLYFHTDFSAN